MKYIRTELHGIAKVRNESDKTISYENSFHEGCLWKQGLEYRGADTIEELCDEFVCGDNYLTHCVFKGDINDSIWKERLMNKDKTISIYGAIWTDKGLIYVAKMNEKGELELL